MPHRSLSMFHIASVIELCRYQITKALDLIKTKALNLIKNCLPKKSLKFGHALYTTNWKMRLGDTKISEVNQQNRFKRLFP